MAAAGVTEPLDLQALELRDLPRAGLRDVALGMQAYFRPGAGRSPLRRLGDRFVVDMPGTPTTFVTCSPDDVRALFGEREGALSLGRALHRLTPHPVLFGDDSLIFLEGDEHIHERRKVAPPFHGERMKGYEEAIAGIARRRVESWPTGEPVPFVDLAQGFVLDVMRSVIFGVSEDERMRRLDRAMVDYCRVTESDAFLGLGVAGVVLTGRWRRYPPLERAAAAVDAIVLEEIAERRATGAGGTDDCLTLFLELNEADEHPKPDEILARDMRGLMLAGYETTAITLGWIMAMLAHHPEALARAEEAVRDGHDDYLDAVISETMRLRPVFPFTGRRVVRDMVFNGVRVPRGAMVVVSIMAVHEREELYDEPRAFRPERFLEARPGTYTWLTFGGGAHRCLGASFATFESRVLLRTLLQHRTLRSRAGRGEPARRTHPMLVPARGGRVTLSARRSSRA